MVNPKTEGKTLPQTNKLKALREQRGLSVEQLEKLAGVRRYAVKHIEQGNAARVYADDITRLLIFFNAQYTELFEV
ncbi:MAG: hypothetical protein CVU94_01965 [Firmicutes bacterium HGW-Firmicutes-19]|jgi:transcriptional regulator with XRE-family HTH domain|nr:MAG: hypothetical protein CVU94_01965 [Firmicutes bacterium HGW-Firmicutes-19]